MPYMFKKTKNTKRINMTFNQAIINYINARADRIRPCKHDWELLIENRYILYSNEKNIHKEWIYRCKKCGLKNKVNTE